MASFHFLVAVLVVCIPAIRSEDQDYLRQATAVLSQCGERDMMECLGVKLTTALDRASRMSRIDLADGVSFVATSEGDASLRGSRALDETELTNSLNQEPEQRSSRLLDLILDATTRFFQTHSLQFKFSDASPEELKRSLEEEGRGRKKQLRMLMPLLLGLGLKLVTLIPIGIGLIGFLAFKALIVSKIALAIGAALGLQKLLGNQNSGWSKAQWSAQPSTGWSNTNSGAGWSSGSGSSTGGYYRSFDAAAASAGAQDAHQLAYNGHLESNAAARRR